MSATASKRRWHGMAGDIAHQRAARCVSPKAEHVAYNAVGVMTGGGDGAQRRHRMANTWKVGSARDRRLRAPHLHQRLCAAWRCRSGLRSQKQ